VGGTDVSAPRPHHPRSAQREAFLDPLEEKLFLVKNKKSIYVLPQRETF
jgi:hypothetical protein